MTDKPRLREALKWIAAYPSIEGRIEKVVWWSVLSTYFLRPVVWFLIGGAFWLVVPKLFGIDIAAHPHLPTRVSKAPPTFAIDFDRLQKEEAQRQEATIKLAKEARTLVAGQTYIGSLPPAETLTNDFQIRVEMDKKKGNIHINGWEARRIDADTYVVTYTYEHGADKSEGWPFEVNILNKVVRYIIGDPELEKKYGWSQAK